MDGHPAEDGRVGHTEFSTVTAMADPGGGLRRHNRSRHAAVPRASGTRALGAQPHRSPLKETLGRGGRAILCVRLVGRGNALPGVFARRGTLGDDAQRPKRRRDRRRLGRAPRDARRSTGRLADPRPAADYRRFNRSNVSVHSWSWNYRSCWHQTCPPVDTHHCVWIASIPSPTGHEDRRDCCSSSLPHQRSC